MHLTSDINLLTSVHESASIGAQTLNDIIPKVNDSKLKQALNSQQSEYKSLLSEAASELFRFGQKPSDPPITKKISAWAGVQVNTIVDKSSSHIAEMIIQGTTTGITEVTKTLNQNRNAKEETQRLAAKFLHTEQNNINQLKGFLH